MTYRRSLRFRVVFTFGLFAAILSIVWGLGVFAGTQLTEDRVLTRQLRIVAEDYARRYQTDPAAALPKPAYIQSYRQADELPSSLREWAAGMPADGYYEFMRDELHVAVLTAGIPPKPLYVVFDVAGIEAATSEDVWWFAGLAAVVLLLTLLAIALGVVVSRRAIDPVIHLAEVVGGMSPEQLSDEDWRRIQADRFHDDEVGLLARTIEKTLQRICAFIDRERYFTSAASHELRTPITVIGGALELLEQPGLSSSASRAVARIKRATVDMQTTIEMFLCLARESDEGLYCEHFAVVPLVEQAIDQHRHLLANKNIAVDVERSATPDLFGHPQAFAIAVGNLVRNAFEHTPHDQGPITVRVDRREVSVSNRGAQGAAGPGQFGPQGARGSESQGFGLGLTIVQRLCEHNGWSCTVRARNDAIDARLSWAPESVGELVLPSHRT